MAVSLRVEGHSNRIVVQGGGNGRVGFRSIMQNCKMGKKEYPGMVWM